MTKSDTYHQILPTLVDWEPYLLQESGLPGPRGNLELAQVVADLGTREQFEHFLTYGPDIAPEGTAHEFLAFCGVVGLGRLAAEGDLALLPRLRQWANDPRWRLREATAMALQRLGDADLPRLLSEMNAWGSGSWLEKRAAAAALAEPRLLHDPVHTAGVLDLFDRLTAAILPAGPQERQSDEFKAFRKGMGYCWSVAVAALPEAGLPLLEKWLGSTDRDVRWILQENLKKKRLERAAPEWLARQIA